VTSVNSATIDQDERAVKVNDDEVWTAIDAQRVRTADLLETLAPEDWDHASLCDGWTVRDVAAHLTLQQLQLVEALLGALRHPGSLNHMIRETARNKAGQPTDRLIAEIRAMVGSRRHNVGLTHLETLIDIVVHGQDIAVPLSRELAVPVEAAATAAMRVWSCRASRRDRWKARVFRRLPYERYRFTATDTSWSVGDGPEIHGPILAILLVLTGRPAGLSNLAGEGAAQLADQFGLAPS
jgi:uncharacterized protein (TIGR03083 family)